MNRIILGYLIGAAAANCWAELPTLVECLALTFVAIALITRRQYTLSGMSLAVVITALAGHYYLVRQSRVDWEQEITTSARVLAVVIFTDHLRLDIHTHRYGNLRLNWWHIPPRLPQPGQTWQFTLHPRRAVGYANPGGFDYLRYLVGRDIVFKGSIYKGVLLQPVGHVRRFFLNWQQRIKQTLAPFDMARLLQALSLGDRQLLTADDWRVLRRTGTSHLFAISGLHLSMILSVVLGIFALFRRLLLSVTRWQDYDGRRWHLWCGAACAAFYCWFSGSAISSQRALLMIVIWAVARSLFWRVNHWRVLGITAMVLLVSAPLTAWDNSFWLSVVAVAVLLFLIDHPPLPQRKLNVFAIQGAMWLLLAPLTVLLFGGTSLVSLPANILLIPLVGFVVLPLILIGVISDWTWPWQLADIACQQGWHYLQWLAGWPDAWLAGHLVIWSSICLSLLVLLRRQYLMCLGVVASVGVIVIGQWLFAEPKTYIDVLDVGQGLSVVVHHRDYTLLYDTGPAFPDGFNTADAVLLPYLRQQRINHLDTVILSHSDNDHAGAYPYLKQAIPIRHTYAGSDGSCRRGLEGTDDSTALRWRALSPERLVAKNNDNSCVLSITLEGHRLLLTGDISQRVEFALIKQGLQQYSLLLIPHHGSQTSSSRTFIAHVAPKWAILSRGWNNRYHLPSEQVVARYHAHHGTRLVDTARSGRIRFIPTAQGWHVSRYRVDEVPRWYDQRDQW